MAVARGLESALMTVRIFLGAVLDSLGGFTLAGDFLGYRSQPRRAEFRP